MSLHFQKKKTAVKEQIKASAQGAESSYADDDESDAGMYVLYDVSYDGYEDISRIRIEKDWHS